MTYRLQDWVSTCYIFQIQYLRQQRQSDKLCINWFKNTDNEIGFALLAS
jgi:hypothetical protein